MKEREKNDLKTVNCVNCDQPGHLNCDEEFQVDGPFDGLYGKEFFQMSNKKVVKLMWGAKE